MLRGVIDPELGSDIVELGMARGAEVGADGEVVVTIALTTAGCPLRAQIQQDVRARVGSLPGVTSVRLDWTEMTDEQRSHGDGQGPVERRPSAPRTPRSRRRPRSSSSPRARAASASRRSPSTSPPPSPHGASPSACSTPTSGASRCPACSASRAASPAWPHDGRKQMVADRAAHRRRRASGSSRWASSSTTRRPRSCGGASCSTAACSTSSRTSAGATTSTTCSSTCRRAPATCRWAWPSCIPRAEVIVVTTPRQAAQKVAIRAVGMARKSYLRVAGVIENMSAFTCDHGETYALFGEGGGEQLATDAGVPLLGEVPLEPSVVRRRRRGDAGGARRRAGGRGVPGDRRPHRRRGRAAGRHGRVQRPHARRRRGRARRPRRRSGRHAGAGSVAPSSPRRRRGRGPAPPPPLPPWPGRCRTCSPPTWPQGAGGAPPPRSARPSCVGIVARRDSPGRHR